MERINLKTRNPADRIALRGVRMPAVLAAMSQKTPSNRPINKTAVCVAKERGAPMMEPIGAVPCLCRRSADVRGDCFER
jgi:hypothetical protein